MKPLCDSIETLAMTFLDGELAGGEARDLELHVVDCAPCRDHLERAAGDHDRRRALLAPPPTPDLLRARVLQALDGEDRRRRRPLAGWALPGGAALAAVAALAVFVGLPADEPAGPLVDKEVVGAVTLNRPLEVRGPAVEPWVRRNFDGRVNLPSFRDGTVKSMGARISRVFDRDAAVVSYQVEVDGAPVHLSVFVVVDARGLPWNGTPHDMGGRTLWLSETQGWSVVKLRDARQRAFVFVTPDLEVERLADLVARTNLVQQLDEPF